MSTPPWRTTGQSRVEACLGKEAFPTGGDARAAARNMKRAGKPVGAYACGRCDRWHVGRASVGAARARQRYDARKRR